MTSIRVFFTAHDRSPGARGVFEYPVEAGLVPGAALDTLVIDLPGRVVARLVFRAPTETPTFEAVGQASAPKCSLQQFLVEMGDKSAVRSATDIDEMFDVVLPQQVHESVDAVITVTDGVDDWYDAEPRFA